MHSAVFLVASLTLIAAQSVLILRALKAARSPDGDRTQAFDAMWTALPGALVLALLAYSLLNAPGG